jgi:hypothetical protein
MRLQSLVLAHGRRVLRSALLWWPLLISAPACGLLFHHHDDKSDRPDENTATLLEVESHHWSDVVIYLMNGNQAERLGTVAGVSTNRFSFPYRHIASGGRLRLRAHPIGGDSFTSEDVVVQPGQSVKWTLESDLRRSSLAIY